MNISRLMNQVRHPWAIALVALAALSVTIVSADETPKTQSVRLVIDYGDGVQKHFMAIDWQADMTVLDVMEAAQKHRRGIRFSYKGKDSTALLNQIDELKNEGAGRNWLYSVNGELGDRSFAICEVGVADTVLWEFRKYR